MSKACTNETARRLAAAASAAQAAGGFEDLRAAQVCLVLAQTFAWHDPINRTVVAQEMMNAIRLLDPDVLRDVPVQ